MNSACTRSRATAAAAVLSSRSKTHGNVVIGEPERWLARGAGPGPGHRSRSEPPVDGPYRSCRARRVPKRASCGDTDLRHGSSLRETQLFLMTRSVDRADVFPGVTFVREKWSGRPDLNRRPPVPQTGALPDCATPRRASESSTGVLRARPRQPRSRSSSFDSLDRRSTRQRCTLLPSNSALWTSRAIGISTS